MKDTSKFHNPVKLLSVRKVNGDNNNENQKERKAKELPTISYFSLYRYVKGFDILLLIVGFISAIITGLLQVCNTIFTANITEELILHGIKLTNKNITSDEKYNEGKLLMEAVTEYAIALSIFGFANLVFTWLFTISFDINAQRQITKIRNNFFSSILNQDISWYDENTTGDFATKVTEDLVKVQEGIGEKVCIFVSFKTSVIGHLIIAFYVGWELALICIVFLPINVIISTVVSTMTTKYAKKETDAYSKSGTLVEEVLSSIKTVVAFDGEKKEINRYNETLNNTVALSQKRNLFNSLGTSFSWFLNYAGIAVGFWFGIKMYMYELEKDVIKKYYVGIVTTVCLSILRSSVYFNHCYAYLELFNIAKGSGTNIFNIIFNSPIIHLNKNKGIIPISISGNIVFENVSFNYPSRSTVPILQGLNLTINAGETIALVGESGSGKSTCLQMIQRFYDPLSGKISLDGNNISNLNLSWLRSHIGVVGQEPILFGTTIAENIKLGKQDASQQEVEKAAKDANAHDFILSLPQGYETLVGERGTQLSGGQKQRIAIARALIRNPTILLLDEATSALDSNSEIKVQMTLEKASKSRTTIIVAHRLSTIRNADKIFVLSKGKVVEIGKHSELMNQKGVYFELVQIQDKINCDIEAFGLSPQDEERETIFNKDFNQEENIESNSENKRKKQNKVKNNYLWKLLKINAKVWIYVIIGGISSIIVGILMPLLGILYTENIKIFQIQDKEEMDSQLKIVFSLLLGLGVSVSLSIFIQLMAINTAGINLVVLLRQKMFKNMLKQDMAWFDKKENGIGALCSKLSLEAAQVQNITGQGLGVILESCVYLLFSLALTMSYNLKLGLAILIVIPKLMFGIYWQNKYLKKVQNNNRQTIGKSNRLALETVMNIRTVVSFGCEEIFHKKYMSELISANKTVKCSYHIKGFLLGLFKSIMFFLSAYCMYFGVIFLLNEEISSDVIIKITQIVLMAAIHIANAFAFIPNLQKGFESTQKIFEIMTSKPTMEDSPNAQNHWREGNICYNNINFSYPTRPETPVLNYLNLLIEKNKTVAIVGPSGSGKSTIFQLLQRFYDPISGEIIISDENIKNYARTKLRYEMAIVSQESTLFNRTIAENISYGDNSREVEEVDIILAAQKANIHNFIASLPMGYQTKIGDKGIQISGGQKQRIAIARALIRNPKILLLDEATSALDTENEKVVQEALWAAKEGRTCITIAHRLSTIQNSDVIFIINNGKIAEYGTHKDLLAQRGIYFKFYAT